MESKIWTAWLDGSEWTWKFKKSDQRVRTETIKELPAPDGNDDFGYCRDKERPKLVKKNEIGKSKQDEISIWRSMRETRDLNIIGLKVLI